MKKDKLSIKIIRRVVFISIILIAMLTIGVVAGKSNLNTITIVCSDDSELSLVTSETNVGKILEDNYIILQDDEKVTPSSDSNIDFTKKIVISKVTDEPIVVAEEVSDVSKEEILGNYVTVTEKIITEQEEIPYETVTKDISTTGTETTDKVIQEGQNGLKETKYKVKYQNDVEIEKSLISEQIIKEPVDKIIQISTKIASRASAPRSTATIAANAQNGEAKVVTMNVSAYTASTCGKAAGSAGYGITSSGKPASSWYTIAAGSAYPIGTVVYIPYFANQPNGGWFVVEDRGGAISNNRIDVYMDTYAECINFGRRNLECYIY